MSAPKYDWAAIEMQFVRGIEQPDGKIAWPTPKDLSTLHGCHIEYIHFQIRKGDWKNKKQAYLLKLELSDGDCEIEDPQKEYEIFQRKTFAAASGTLSIIIKKLDLIIKNQEYNNLSDIDKLIKILERLQLIAKNSIGDNLDDFESARSEFEKLMAKLKSDEKTEKNLPEPLPAITVADL
jgi:hypothetical protein